MVEKLPPELQEKAVSLRRQGWTYREIAGSLGISISTCSLYLRDIPAPERPLGYTQERVAAMWKGRWEPYHQQTEQRRRETKLAACDEIGDLSDREILMAGALIYWCEGSKDKIYRRSEWIRFMNSDPALIILFLRFLKVAGAPQEHLQFRLHIHENADVEEATRYWADLVGVPAREFKKPTLKRHNPKTRRKNLRDDYHGCLQVTVLQSAELYRRVEGWAHGAMLGPEVARAYLIQRSEASLRRLVEERGVSPN